MLSVSTLRRRPSFAPLKRIGRVSADRSCATPGLLPGRSSRITSRPRSTTPTSYPHSVLPKTTGFAVLSPTSAVLLLVVGSNALVMTRAGDWNVRLFVNVTSPTHLQGIRFDTLFTSTFVHLTWSDFFLNMGGLIVFGRGVARVIGAARFLRTYAACGVASAVTGVAIQARTDEEKHMFGAAGAVNAMAVINLVLCPQASTAPFVYGVLRTLEWGFCGFEVDSTSRQIGHASGLVWGGLLAVHLRRSLRLIH